MAIKKLIKLSTLLAMCLMTAYNTVRVTVLVEDVKQYISEPLIQETVVEKIVEKECEQEHFEKPEPRNIKVRISFYTNEDNELEGDQYDKMGKLLTEHDYPVVAMPSDVPYGSILVIKGIPFTVVDTGGAMKWTGDNECNIDVFIPNKTTEWLNEHTGVFYSDAQLYIKQDN